MRLQPCDCCGQDDEFLANDEGVVICICGNKWIEIEVSPQPEDN